MAHNTLIQQVWEKQCHSTAWKNNPQEQRQKVLGCVIKTSPALTQKTSPALTQKGA